MKKQLIYEELAKKKRIHTTTTGKDRSQNPDVDEVHNH